VRWARTPKALTVAALLLLAMLELPARGAGALAVVLLTGLVGGAADAGMAWLAGRRVPLPDGGVITGLIVALVIDPTQSLVAPLAATLAGLAAKHALRTRWSNILNPAAVGLIVAYLVLGRLQSWGGALPDLPTGFLAVLLLVGVRSVHGWSWARSIGVLALAAALPVLIVLSSHFLHLGNGFGE